LPRNLGLNVTRMSDEESDTIPLRR
jgi:hypothetical protein